MAKVYVQDGVIVDEHLAGAYATRNGVFAQGLTKESALRNLATEEWKREKERERKEESE